MNTQHATHAQPRMHRAARILARMSEQLQAYHPTWPPRWLAELGDYLTTSLAGALRLAAAVLVVVT